MDSRNKPIARKTDLVEQNLNDELLVYDLLTNKAYCLNQTSALVYRLCDGSNSVSDISRKLSVQLKQTVPEDFVWLAVDQFKIDNLLSGTEEMEIDFNGLSRRQVIRKLGFASMIALPVVCFLVAPTPAAAQSVDCSCINPGNCLTKPSCPSTVNCNPAGQCAP